MVYTPVAPSNVAVPGGVTLPTSDWFSKMPSELLGICAAARLDPTNPNANAENASHPVPLFFRFTMNVSLVDGITLQQDFQSSPASSPTDFLAPGLAPKPVLSGEGPSGLFWALTSSIWPTG